jgi:CRP-like cAMP-binding protein
VSAMLEAGGEHADRVRVFGPRMLVGEIAFMLRVPRTASLRVEEDAIVWSLGRHAFEKLTGSDAALVFGASSRRAALAIRKVGLRHAPSPPDHIVPITGLAFLRMAFRRPFTKRMPIF